MVDSIVPKFRSILFLVDLAFILSTQLKSTKLVLGVGFVRMDLD